MTGSLPAAVSFWYTITQSADKARGRQRFGIAIMRTAIKTLCGLICILAITAGCGQKGPLFLPGDPGAVQTNVPDQNQSGPSSEDSDDDPENEDEDER